MYTWHEEPHMSIRNNWLRAMVLGANDGLISTASLLMGMSAANTSPSTIILTAIAALVAGMISMAAGEYVSVASQKDTEDADRKKEELELSRNPEKELEELKVIYTMRGLDKELAEKVAIELTQHDALDAHLRDEVGLSSTSQAKPLQAALASALSFVLGAIIPVLVATLTPASYFIWILSTTTLIALALLGYLSAYLGGASAGKAVCRVVMWGGVALLSTNIVGNIFGVALG